MLLQTGGTKRICLNVRGMKILKYNQMSVCLSGRLSAGVDPGFSESCFTTRRSNEYEYEYGLFLYNAM